MHRGETLFVAQIILFFQVLECAVYPSIHWSPQNPLFDKNDSVIYVLPMSRVHIVCPNPTTVMKRVKDSASKDKLYQNLWIVSRESYERCNTDYTQGSRLLLRCNTPLTLKYYTLVFQRYSAVSSQVFIPGKEYYFIATSDGTRGSVYKRSGGNCQDANMKLRITVCINNKDPRCNPQVKTTTTTTTTTTSTTTTTTTTTTTKAKTATTMATAKMSADLTSHDAISSTNASSTTLRNAKLTAHPPIGGVKLPTTLPVSESSSRAVTWTTEAESQDVLAHASSRDRVMSRHRSVLDAVSELNWIIIVPLMACLFLSLLGNIILVCRLRFRQQEYELQEKDHRIVEAVAVKHLEPPKTESRVEKTLLLFRRSADVTEV